MSAFHQIKISAHIARPKGEIRVKCVLKHGMSILLTLSTHLRYSRGACQLIMFSFTFECERETHRVASFCAQPGVQRVSIPLTHHHTCAIAQARLNSVECSRLQPNTLLHLYISRNLVRLHVSTLTSVLVCSHCPAPSSGSELRVPKLTSVLVFSQM